MNRTRLDPWTCLTAGIPLTLLLDLAAAPRLDSKSVLVTEAVAALAAEEWAAADVVDLGQAFIA
jgi:hypothetical protein